MDWFLIGIANGGGIFLGYHLGLMQKPRTAVVLGYLFGKVADLAVAYATIIQDLIETLRDMNQADSEDVTAILDAYTMRTSPRLNKLQDDIFEVHKKLDQYR